MAFCLNWQDCRVCDSEMRCRSCFSGYDVRPERAFYKRSWENEEGMKSEGRKKETEENIQSEVSPTDQEGIATRRRRRATYKRWQVDVLEEAFAVNCYPSTLMKKILAARLNMENIQVQVWFQNRRARMNKDGPSPYTRTYLPSSLHTHPYPQASSYARYNSAHLPYDEEILYSMDRRQPGSYVTPYPFVTPMFSRFDLDRVLYQHSPVTDHACSPRRPRHLQATIMTSQQERQSSKIKISHNF